LEIILSLSTSEMSPRLEGVYIFIGINWGNPHLEELHTKEKEGEIPRREAKKIFHIRGRR
jgi:hypothetical protein